MRITTFKVAAFALFSVSALQVPQTLAAAPSQQPLFLGQSAPPLMMLVMQRDHKLYYEAYNDASDLDEDGGLDIGFKPSMEYLGYFDSNLCYEYVSNRFEPKAKATNMKCSGQWAGNFLNYQTTSRMDALRRVLYGGMRYTDTTTDTALQRAFIPQDAHSWGKEYNSETIDGYKISDYTPLSAPSSGKRHLFANTTLSGATPPQPPAPSTRKLHRSLLQLGFQGTACRGRLLRDRRQLYPHLHGDADRLYRPRASMR